MGSRAVVALCRDAQAAETRFGSADELGQIWTRTGRPFFDDARTPALVDKLRHAMTAEGLWDELNTSWVLLDCELLPWSVKADELLRTQYAAVGAAARSVLPAAVGLLAQAAARGVDVADLHARTSSRARNADDFTAAYRRYVWATDGIDGISVAPFQVLATEGRTFTDQDHLWHLDIADRLRECAPEHLRLTRRVAVDTSDDLSVAAGVAWWTELTDAGGEGMVVKPLGNLVRGTKGWAQPGIKVRGREYLRIVYGPDYNAAANLDRLRSRNLSHKRSLAAREYALSIEALERVARGEPLWRIHEAVFGVLALESEPVDPRL